MSAEGQPHMALVTDAMIGPERIFLAPKCCEVPNEGRLWCEDDVWFSDCEDGNQGIEYVRADLAMQSLSAQSGDVVDVECEAARIVAENIEKWGWGPLDDIEGLSEHQLAINAAEAGYRAAIAAMPTLQDEGRLREAAMEAGHEAYNQGYRDGYVDAHVTDEAGWPDDDGAAILRRTDSTAMTDGWQNYVDTFAGELGQSHIRGRAALDTPTGKALSIDEAPGIGTLGEDDA